MYVRLNVHACAHTSICYNVRVCGICTHETIIRKSKNYDKSRFISSPPYWSAGSVKFVCCAAHCIILYNWCVKWARVWAFECACVCTHTKHMYTYIYMNMIIYYMYFVQVGDKKCDLSLEVSTNMYKTIIRKSKKLKIKNNLIHSPPFWSAGSVTVICCAAHCWLVYCHCAFAS